MKKIIVTLILGIIIGFVLASILIDFLSNEFVDHYKTYGILEIVYYISQPIGVLATFLAVFVAIFNGEIRNIFFNKSCKVTIERDGFVENLGNTEYTIDPVAQSYDCTAVFHNNGSRELTNVQLQIKEIEYLKLNGKKAHKLHVIENQYLYWWINSNKKINISVKDTKKLCLARINPESSSETPDGQKKSPLCISIMGHNLNNSHNQSGSWSIKYALYSDSSILKTFTLVISWSGEWRNRLTEMANEVSATIK